LLNVDKSGSRVTFNFDVTSLKNDKAIRLEDYEILLYDENGIVSKATNIVIGNRSSTIVEYTLVKLIPVPLKITFRDITTSAQYATLFKVGFSDKETTGNFEFREIYFGDESEDLSEVIEEKGNWSKETLGFKYDLLYFDKTSTTVVFTFTITSVDRDKIILLKNHDIFLYDDKGLETKADIITIGNLSRDIVEYNLVQGAKVPLIISFKNIASSATGVALLKVGFSDHQNVSNFQIRNLKFTKSASASAGKKSSSCSEIYFYRKKAFLECEETVYLYNHGELLLKLEAGTRYKSVVCDDRSFKFSVKTDPNLISYSTSKPDIELGGKYYIKISCTVGVATVALQEIEKGEKDLSNNGKFKRKLGILALPEY